MSRYSWLFSFTIGEPTVWTNEKRLVENEEQICQKIICVLNTIYLRLSFEKISLCTESVVSDSGSFSSGSYRSKPFLLFRSIDESNGD